MNYLDKRTLEHFDIIKSWAVNEYPNQGRYKQLVDAAVKAKRSKTHHHLDTDYSEEERKLMDIFYLMILDDKSFSDEPTPSRGYFKTADDFAVEAYYREGYLRFRLSVGCGSYMTCEYVRTVPKKLTVYSYDHLHELIDLKYRIFKKHVEAIEKKIKEAQARKDELKKTLAAVDTANTLMSIFGLHLDEASEQKVNEWRKELEQVKKV
jgi:Skp family chaperone for outer membrane proteins